MKAYISGAVYLPLSQVTPALLDDLTIRYWQIGESEARLVPAFEEYENCIAVPRDFGLKLIAKRGIKAENRMSSGTRMPFPKAVVHAGKYAYQKAFVDSILQTSKEQSDFIVHAATGKGKTVCSLSVIQKRGRSALVIVDQDNLMQQWIEECKSALGLREDQIGIVQGGRCDYEGKHVTIAMMQTLVQREYPEEFYDAFGTVVFDEVHTAGAPTFSRALLMFSAEVRFGVSATVDRRDALQKLIHWNLGQVEVSLLDKHDRSYVYFMENATIYSWYANISPKAGRILAEVSEDAARNEKLVQAILWLFEEGREVLVISDRIEQLENLMAMCYYAGVDDVDMGLYCGYRNVWKWQQDATPKRRPHGYVRGTEYSPVALQAVHKRTPKKELEAIKKEKRIIFATFGMFAKGVDVPRLSAGVDCTPRSRAQQVHGRILRVQEGKLVPIWITVRDFNSYRLDYQFLQRIDEYVSSSAEIYEWKPSKGVRSWDVRDLKKEIHLNIKELKALNIITCVDGSNTLVTPPTPIKQGSPRGRPTGKTTR